MMKLIEEILACNFCGSIDFETHLTKHTNMNSWAQFTECKKCGLIMQQLPISLDVYYERFRTGIIGLKSYQMLFLERNSYIGLLDNLLRTHADKVDWLYDMGCGLGLLLNEAAVRGIQVMGNDVNIYSCRYAWDHGHLVYNQPTHKVANDLPANQFDIVVMKSYLAHSPYPYSDLLTAYRILRPGGMLFIREAILGKVSYLHHEELEIDHLTFLTKRVLTDMLREAKLMIFNQTNSIPRRKCYDSKVDIYAHK